MYQYFFVLCNTKNGKRRNIDSKHNKCWKANTKNREEKDINNKNEEREEKSQFVFLAGMDSHKRKDNIELQNYEYTKSKREKSYRLLKLSREMK